jgi:hypothetical protein
MLSDDLFDLTEKIVAARSLPITEAQIKQAKMTTERLSVKLTPPLWVDINYDTQVVEDRVLHLYPDVYGRDATAVESLRTELQSSGVEVSKLDPQLLQQMLARVSLKEEFAISIADLKAGHGFVAGGNQPLTDYSVEKKPVGKRVRRSAVGT